MATGTVILVVKVWGWDGMRLSLFLTDLTGVFNWTAYCRIFHDHVTFWTNAKLASD
ncbi:UNVERIFIED_CONTAM: hypothetical protein FKN15_007592 [Acipenser sinensis]